MRKPRVIDTLMNEVILYGGMPLRRGDVYRDVLARTDDQRCAEYFAFGVQNNQTTWEPLTLAEYQAIDPLPEA